MKLIKIKENIVFNSKTKSFYIKDDLDYILFTDKRVINSLNTLNRLIEGKYKLLYVSKDYYKLYLGDYSKGIYTVQTGSIKELISYIVDKLD